MKNILLIKGEKASRASFCKKWLTHLHVYSDLKIDNQHLLSDVKNKLGYIVVGFDTEREKEDICALAKKHNYDISIVYLTDKAHRWY